jgi:hypothetical protein
MPVSTKGLGTLAPSNVMTVCANHHRQMHYGGIHVTISEKFFEFTIDTKSLKVARFGSRRWIRAGSTRV